MTSLPQTKKSLGQHWLSDEASLTAMSEAVGVQATDTILEIGPGPGTLTRTLVKKAEHVIAVEFDSMLAKELQNRVGAENLEVVEQDILQFDLTQLPLGYKVVANIPYYLTSNLIRILCESNNPFSQAALLVQKEVAERIAASAGSMSLLSVSVQLYCDVSLGRVVKAELFTPPPKVDSQIVILKYRDTSLFPELDTKQFFHVVKAGFSARRKKLRSSLSGGLRISKPEVEALLKAADIDQDLRAQALGLDDWYRLYIAYNKMHAQKA